MLEKAMEFSTVIENFEDLTKDAGRAQIETLRRILEENGEAEYLLNLGLGGRTDPESFKSYVPLCTHKDLEPYIQRIADGDASPILMGKPITSLSLSSGTTQGRPKLVPFNDELVRATMQMFRTSFAFRNRSYPIDDGKALQFNYSSKQFTTKGGLTATTATSNVYRSKHFNHTMNDMRSQCTSPNEVIFCPDFHQALYCHLLCGLIQSDQVQLISSAFAYSIVHAFRMFEQIWEELCADIRHGVLSSRITIPSIREAISGLLHPDPILADSIYNRCVGLSSCWYGVIPELWPNAKYIYGIMTGSMEPYLNKLRHYAGNLPLLSADYGSSEGWIAANVNPELPPESTAFAVIPDIGYFEFIPLREKPGEQEIESSAPTLNYTELEPVGLTEVEVGEEYEIVITNFAGFYRYRLGDVVKVTGFHNLTPELQFVCRRSLVLSVNIDKHTERDLQLAVEQATMLLEAEKLEVIDFTSNVDMSTDPGHYVVFLELSGEVKDEVMNICCDLLDQAFVDDGYARSRKARTIGPLELRVVREGTFQKILDHYISLGAAVSQFKTPRNVGASNSKVLQILNGHLLKSCFSNAFG